MKKRVPIIAVLAALAVLLLAACGGAGDSSSEAAKDGSIKGIVTDATMNTVTIQVPSGSLYTFPTEGAEISSPEGLLIGDDITIQYTGTFDEGTQVQNVTVTSIFVNAEGDGNPDDGAAPAAQEPPASVAEVPTGDVKSIQGTIEQYDGGDTMMIVDATGVDYLFSLEGADLHVGEEGFQVGDIVIIYYYGELESTPDLQKVQVGEVKKADQ